MESYRPPLSSYGTIFSLQTPIIKAETLPTPVLGPSSTSWPSSSNLPHNRSTVDLTGPEPSGSRGFIHPSRSRILGLEHSMAPKPKPQELVYTKESPSVNVGNSELADLTRELWNVRREIATLKAREDILVKKIQPLDLTADQKAANEVNGAQSLLNKIKEQEIEIEKLRGEISWQNTTRNRLKENYDIECKLRRRAESILNDMRYESNVPLLLPAMKLAFERLSELTGEALHSQGRT